MYGIGVCGGNITVGMNMWNREYMYESLGRAGND